MLLKKSKSKRKVIRLLLTLLVVALLSPFIANHRPLYMKYKGSHFFPAFSFKHFVIVNNETINFDQQDFKTLDTESIIYTLIPWSPGKSDFLNSYANPFGKQYMRDNEGGTIAMPLHFRHWLGTNSLGADVLAGMLHGLRYSFFIAFIAMLIASLIGIVFGALAGYYGNNKLKVSNASTWSFLILFLYLLFYSLNKGKYHLQVAASAGMFNLLMVFSLIIICFILGFLALKFLFKKIRIPYFQVKRSFPIDSIVSRAIEITMAMPRLILIITLAAIIKPTFLNLGIIIGITLWTEIARFTRAQAIQIREQEFILAARAMGFSNMRILLKHVLANGLGPVLVVICFAFSSVILTESGLSFLGVGIPRQAVTWGTMLSSGRENFDAWWLTLFPGCCILFTVLLFYKIADTYYQLNDYSLKNK